MTYLMNSANHLIKMSEQDYLKFKQRVTADITPARREQLKALGAAMRSVKPIPIRK